MKNMMKPVKRAAELESFDYSNLGWSVEKTTRLYEATEKYKISGYTSWEIYGFNMENSISSFAKEQIQTCWRGAITSR